MFCFKQIFKKLKVFLKIILYNITNKIHHLQIVYKHEIIDCHDEEPAYFEVKINMDINLSQGDVDFGFDYLQKFGSVEDPLEISDFSEIKRYIMLEIPNLKNKIEEIKYIIESSKKLHVILEDIESNILPRLKLFSNYSHISVISINKSEKSSNVSSPNDVSSFTDLYVFKYFIYFLIFYQV